MYVSPLFTVNPDGSSDVELRVIDDPEEVKIIEALIAIGALTLLEVETDV